MGKAGAKRKLKKPVRVLLWVIACLLALAAALLAVLQIGFWVADTWTPYVPDYEMEDISGILGQEELSEEDYETLYRQTGLTKLGIDGLLESGDTETVLDIQEDFFAGYELERDNFAPFTCQETVSWRNAIHMANLEDGDVIVSSGTHFSFVRFGHSAIVVNASSQHFLNAVGYDQNSALVGIGEMNVRSSFMILRLKADEETRTAIAQYARKNLVGIEYSIFAGLFGNDLSEIPSKTQCAHLIWYAYAQFGYDIDSNGGLLVLPKDIANSDLFDVVQVYGFDLDGLWS